jgi:hypothetical protein
MDLLYFMYVEGSGSVGVLSRDISTRFAVPNIAKARGIWLSRAISLHDSTGIHFDRMAYYGVDFDNEVLDFRISNNLR